MGIFKYMKEVKGYLKKVWERHLIRKYLFLYSKNQSLNYSREQLKSLAVQFTSLRELNRYLQNGFD